MSFGIDTNILFYATDSASPFQKAATEFLEECWNGEEPVCLTWGVLLGYVRLVTHPRVLRMPLSPEQALENVDRLTGSSNVRVLQEEAGFLDVYRSLTKGLLARGNLVPDAHLATILRQHGVRTLYTADADFRRFAFLDVRNPVLS